MVLSRRGSQSETAKQGFAILVVFERAPRSPVNRIDQTLGSLLKDKKNRECALYADVICFGEVVKD